MTARPYSITHPVPGTDLEVSVRPFYLGAVHGWRWGVAVYAQGNGKVSWRQRGTEYTFEDEAEALARANALWAAVKARAAGPATTPSDSPTTT